MTFIRQKLPNLWAGSAHPGTRVVFNCTGNAARTLPGVEDVNCYPTRGQVLLAKAPRAKTNIMRHGRDDETFVIPRPLSNGHVILMGYMQKGNSDAAMYGHEMQDILKRTTELSTELSCNDFDVVAAFSGLRPLREGGARIDRDEATFSGTKRPLIHNYGAGETGFQAGYGMALEAVDLAEDILRDMRSEFRARLWTITCLQSQFVCKESMIFVFFSLNDPG